jgi:periplasmic divalent cation tolerance protein
MSAPDATPEAILLYVTCSSLDEAERIARAIVEQQLAACANIIPGMVSWYQWQGRLERGEEYVLICKSAPRAQSALITAIQQLHSYSVPCIVVVPIIGGLSSYVQWIDDNVRQ